MKVVIVEDELPSSRRLERILTEFNYEILAKLVSVNSTVDWLRKNEQPDILFLDIHLSDGLCFEIFNQIEIKSLIIFTTAYDQYSIRAFDYNSISYLLKPISKDQVLIALEKATTFYSNKNELLELKRIIQENGFLGFKNRFVVKIGKKTKIIGANDIECFFSQFNSTYLRSGSFDYPINTSLNNLKNDLDPRIFFKVNRSFIVSVNAVKGIGSYQNNRLKLQLKTYNEQDIIVSREKTKSFKRWISN
ncbi:DNA-binding response regulator [Arenibacter sp. TNZ]|uniref:LytR/AlgR family response regulator transcription factor n=1 Tax=Arenibacter TaxID=178469 RepID=UPI000CD3CB1A|nr:MULTISPECIES: LytTR family DNA-binding domain-containing protein [Arenibacter]MCM4173972.1 DNA-binding response regulator [Arenibacter sp. TNZ]